MVEFQQHQDIRNNGTSLDKKEMHKNEGPEKKNEYMCLQ